MNEQMNGEEWSGFISDGERGKRAYLRAMSTEGEWTDHVMITATSKALRRKVVVYSQTEKTSIGGEEEGEIHVGFIREQHYFGVEKIKGNKVEKKNQKKQSEGIDEGRKKADGAVFNLGVDGLTEEMEDLLSLGLKFVPVQRVKKSKVEADVERLKVKLMWDVYWKWVSENEEGEGSSQRQQNGIEEEEEMERKQREEERRKERKFEGKTEKTPAGLPARWRQSINKYCEAVKEDIFTGLKRRPKGQRTI